MDCLSPLSKVFSFVGQARFELYRKNILKSTELSKPVISVGNLTVGGTGKTPFVDYLLNAIEAQGKRACVLTRGYGRQSSKPVIVTSQTSTDTGGDEPIWLARRHPKAIIAVGKNRTATARQISDVDVFILDDGFQHLRVKRDFDVVLMDATRPWRHYAPLPSGRSREDFKSLGRADMVILTRANLSEASYLERLKKKVLDLGVKWVFESDLTVTGCRSVWGTDNGMNISGKKVFLVSGIGNPESFESLVKKSGAIPVYHQKNQDHFRYTQQQLNHYARKAVELGADLILTTEKDATKWCFFEKPREFSNDIAELQTTLKFNKPLPDIYDLATHRAR